jgi:hypothetical protein
MRSDERGVACEPSARTDFLRVCSESQECCRRAVRFVETTQDHNGSWGDPANCYDTALAILTLTQCGSDVRTVARGVASIVEHQGADGSWGCDVPIWTFRYADDPLVVCRGLDAERMITTSLCVSALRSARGEG